MIASISLSENNPVASSSSFLALSVIESAPALTAPAAAETVLLTPLTIFLSPLFRRPSFLFAGAGALEDPPDGFFGGALEDAPVSPEPEESDDPEELEDPEEEDPPPCLPLSYPLLAALLTALPAL